MSSALARLRDDLLWVLSPITSALSGRREFDHLMLRMGWNPEAFGENAYLDLTETLNALRAALIGESSDDGLVGILDGFEGVDDYASWDKLLHLVLKSILPLLKDGGRLALGEGDAGAIEALAEDLVAFLVCRYLEFKAPVAFHLFIALDVLRPKRQPEEGRIPARPAAPPSDEDAAADPPLRFSRLVPAIDFKRFAGLISGGAGLLDPFSPEEGPWRWPTTRREARRVRDLLFPRLGAIAVDLGGEAWFIGPGLDWNASPELLDEDDSPLAPPYGQLVLTLPLSELAPVGESVTTAVLLQLVAPEDGPEGKPALWMSLQGGSEISLPFGSCALKLTASGETPALALSPKAWRDQRGEDWALSMAASTAAVSLDATLASSSDGEPAFRVGASEGSHFQLDSWSAGLFLSASPTGWDFGVHADLTGGELRLRAPDDGFLASILPPDGLGGEFSLGLRWSMQQGLRFEGGIGLSLDIPIEKKLFGVLTIHSLWLSAEVSFTAESWSIPLEVGLSFSAVLGPLQFSVERLGVQAKIDHSGLDIDVLWPTGVSVGIETSSVSGGGYLSFEADHYKGLLAVAVADQFSVSIYGLLDTRFPDGSKGFALLGLIFVEFDSGIQLGYGFVLLGVGGIFGINRGFKTEPLIDLFRAGHLDALCFPEHPVEDAPVIFSALGAIFPAERGHYVFGPFVKIGWGVGPLINLCLGVLVALPEPIYVVLIGKLSLELPKQDKPIIALNCDVLGILDIAGGYLSLEARLRDSRLLQRFPMEGGMFLLMKWSDPPVFVFSVGGFHPRFNRPAGVPDLPRMGMSLSFSSAVRLEVGGYFAVTSNSLQLGANAELYIGDGDYNIHGWLGFDALLYFKPLYFEVEIRAGVEVLGFTLKADLSLQGPNPWHVKGQVKIDLWIDTVHVHFDKTFGKPLEEQDDTPPEDPLLLLEAQLTESSAWAGAGLDADVVLAKGATGLPPTQDLVFCQKQVPLGTSISRLHERALDPPVRLSLQPTGDYVIPSGVRAPQAWFAPAHFQELSEKDKLTQPAFKQMNAGIALDRRAATGDDPPREDAPTGFEDIAVPVDGQPTETPTQTGGFTISPAAICRLRNRKGAPGATLRGISMPTQTRRAS